MSALLALLVLAGVPVQCKADLACFLAELKTCGPASYEDSNLDPLGTGKAAGVTPIGVTEYVVALGKEGHCTLSIQTRVDAIELSSRLLSELGHQAPKKRATALQAARDDGVLRRCVMPGEQIRQALERKSNGGWSACKPAGCPELIPADNGCSWSDCTEASRVLSCGEPPKDLRCAPWSAGGPPKPGVQSPRRIDHLEDPRPCVARCQAPNGEPQVVCR